MHHIAKFEFEGKTYEVLSHQCHQAATLLGPPLYSYLVHLGDSDSFWTLKILEMREESVFLWSFPAPDLSAFKRGTIIRHKAMGDSYVVQHNDGRTVFAIRSVSVTNPSEWEIFQKPEIEDLKDQLEAVTNVLNGSSTMEHLDAFRVADWESGERAKLKVRDLEEKISDLEIKLRLEQKVGKRERERLWDRIDELETERSLE